MEESEKPIMFTMYRDITLGLYYVVPTNQIKIFLAHMELENIEVKRLIEDDDLDFLNAVGPVLLPLTKDI